MDTQETWSLVEFLTSVDLLSALTRIDIERLARSAQSRLLAFGDTVCTAGEAAEGLFIVKSGSIRVFAADGEKETSLGVKQARAGQEILKQGSREDRRLYVVRHGEVRVVRHEEGNDYLLATLRKGETFGERACLMRQEQAASVIACADTALLVIPEKTAHLIFERNP